MTNLLKHYLFLRRDVRGSGVAAVPADDPAGFCVQKPRLPLAISCRHACDEV
jgi:hypothetical protein